jgi:hypothetical protein
MVAIGSLEVDAFMLPDGSYRMSQTQVAECIQDDPIYARRFLTSKALKSLQGEGYTPDTFDVDPSDQDRGQTRIQGWPLEIVYAYWVYRCFKGSKPAFSLVMALGSESLERRFDNVFGMERSEADRNQILSDRLHTLKRNLEKLGEGFALEDIVRQERDYLEKWCSDRGLDPWRDIDSSDE